MAVCPYHLKLTYIYLDEIMSGMSRNTLRSRLLPSDLKSYQTGILGLLYLAMITFWIVRFDFSTYYNSKDNMDYSQMGTQILSGNGFSTGQIFPGFLKFLKEKNQLEQQHWPNLHRFPLPQLSNAFSQLFFEPMKAGIVQSGFWFIISIPALFIIIHRLVNFPTAIICILFFYMDSLKASYSGLSESFSTFLLLLLVYAFFFSKCSIKRKSIYSGILLGLLMLTRTTFVYLLPVLIIYFITKPFPKRNILLLSILTLAIMSPWLIRNYLITANPFFSFSNARGLSIPLYPVDPVKTLSFEHSIAETVAQNKKAITINFIKNFSNIFDIRFPLLEAVGILALISLLFLFLIKNSKSIEYAWYCLSIYVLNFMIYSFFQPDKRYFQPLKPLFLILFVWTFFLLFRRFNAQKSGYLVLSVLFVLLLIKSNDPTIHRNDAVLKEINEIKNLSKVIDKDSIVVSDISHKITLLSKRKSIRLPIDPAELEEIDHDYLKIDYLVLSNHLPGYYQAYSPYLKDPSSLPNFTKIPYQSSLYLIFKRNLNKL